MELDERQQITECQIGKMQKPVRSNPRRVFAFGDRPFQTWTAKLLGQHGRTAPNLAGKFEHVCADQS